MWRGTEGQSVSTSSGHRGRLIRRSWPETGVLFDEAEDSTSATSTQINSQSLPAKSLREVREWGAAGRTRVAGVRLRSETSFRVLTVTDRASCSYCNQLMLKLTLEWCYVVVRKHNVQPRNWGKPSFFRLSNSNPPIWLPIHFHGEQYLMTLLLSTDIVKLNKNSFFYQRQFWKRECLSVHYCLGP